MFPADLIARYRAAGRMAATVESCTRGLIAALLTEIRGLSSMLERGFVTYSNAAKQELLGVPAEVYFAAVDAVWATSSWSSVGDKSGSTTWYNT